MADHEGPVPQPGELADRFEAERPRLRAIAVRMLGPGGDADDAVQETWLRLARSDHGAIDNLAGWLTTVIGRVCLNVLRTRSTRAETNLDPHVPDPVVRLRPTPTGGADPEQEAETADAVGLALLVVLDTLPPAERLAFVLHDVFATPFDEIATIMERSPAAVRQLASRGRRRVRGERPGGRGDGPAPSGPAPGGASTGGSRADGPEEASDPARRRAVVDAFFRAARSGDMAALVAVLDPDVVLRADAGPGRPGSAVVRGAAAVAGRATLFAGPARTTHAAWVGGDPAAVVTVGGRVVAVMRFAVAGGLVLAIDALADPDRLDRLAVPVGPPDPT